MRESARTKLADATALLAQAWQRRSPGERSAFVNRLSTAVAPPDCPEDMLEAIRQRAALSGALAPADLVRGFDSESAALALDVLAPEFDRIQATRGWVWTLRAEPRRDTLARLTTSGKLAAVLEEVASILTDPAGELLRAVAATGSVPPASPATTVQALAWAQPLAGLAGELAEAQRQAAVASLRASYDALVRYDVFGREAELTQLRDFAEETLEPSQPVPMLPVTGIGGAGKSTVLGSFVQPYLDRIAVGDPAAPAVVVIDFDRLEFRPGAELALSFELTSQLGLAEPIAAADFAALRYQVRAERRQSASDTYRSSYVMYHEAQETSGFESEAGVLVQLHRLNRRPVLLVLDTFEEWQRERPDPAMPRLAWNQPETQIMDWIGRVRYQMGLEGLRVVVCGRADLTGVNTRPPVRIGDLQPQAAHALVQALGVDADDSEALVALVGGNPLTLHVTTRFYQGLSTAARRDFLAGDPLAAGGLSDELRRTVLYERFLDHIDDEWVHTLAHPGLVLRRVTADLVQHVLAGPCGLGPMTRDAAEQLTARLAAEVWLVNETSDGLHHRPDVRRPMLKLMSEDPRYAAIARQIHADAAAWYESGRDPVLPTDAAEVEALYHRMMLENGDEPVAEAGSTASSDPLGQQWARLAQALGETVDELPPKVAAQVRALRGDEISDRDAVLLPDPVWQQWVTRHGAALVENGLATGALEIFGSRPTVLPVMVEPPWLAQAYSDTARWGEYWRAASALSLPMSGIGPMALRSGRYAMLAALNSSEPDDMAGYEDTLSAYFGGPTDASEPSAIFERLFLHLLCTYGVPASRRYQPAALPWLAPRLAYEIAESSLSRGGEQGIIDLYPIDQLRRVMTWIAASSSAEFVLEKLAAFVRPDMRWMKDFAWLVGAEGKELDSYLERLTAAADTARTDELLGEWAIGYIRVLGRQRIRLNRSRIRNAAERIHVLRGDNPELRPSIMLALREVAAEPDGMLELGRIARPLLPVLPADLHPEALGVTGWRELTQLVDYVDRSGVMPEFVSQVSTTWPASALLGSVATALRVWDDANRLLLDALVVHLRSG